MYNRLIGRENEMQRDVTPQNMSHRRLHRFELMKFAVSSRLSTTQKRYNRVFDESIGREPTFKVEDNVFVDYPQFAVIA